MKHYRYDRGYPLFDDTYTIELTEYESVKETNKGYWIKSKYGKERFVLKDSRKRHAYPTKKEAFNSFKLRTAKSLSYAKSALLKASIFIELVNKHELVDGKIIEETELFKKLKDG